MIHTGVFSGHRFNIFASPRTPSAGREGCLYFALPNKDILSVSNSSPVTLSRGLAARVIPTAAVERALFHRARSGSKGMPWLRDRPLTATRSPHIPSQSNTAPPHR